MTMVGVSILAVWAVSALIGLIGAAWWLRRLWKGRSELTSWSKGAAVLFSASATLGLSGTLLGLAMTFRAIGGESVDPSQQAQLLAEGISEAMNCTAFAILIGVPSAVVLLTLTRTRRGKTVKRAEE